MKGDEEEDAEFSALVKELCPHLSAVEYVDFDVTVSTTEFQFGTHVVDWQQKARNECIKKIIYPQGLDNEIISDDTN